MSDFKKIEDEWRLQISPSEWWKIFKEEIVKKRDLAVSHCLSDEDVKSHQGEARALKWVLSLPQELLEKLRK